MSEAGNSQAGGSGGLLSRVKLKISSSSTMDKHSKVKERPTAPSNESAVTSPAEEHTAAEESQRVTAPPTCFPLTERSFAHSTYSL